MKIGMYVFSGTGNTLRVCTRLANELKKFGHETQLTSIKKDRKTPVSTNYDCLIIGYPVHAFNAPAPVLKFLKSLPQATREISVYLVRTSGEPLKLNDAAGITPKNILIKRGYQALGEFSYVMPYNIIFRHSNRYGGTNVESCSIANPARCFRHIQSKKAFKKSQRIQPIDIFCASH